MTKQKKMPLGLGPKKKLPDFILVCKEESGRDNTEKFDLQEEKWKKANVRYVNICRCI